MKPSSYTFNPINFVQICDAVNPTLIQKGILLELLNRCWQGKTPGNSGTTSEKVAASLGCNISEISETISLFSPFDMIIEELELKTFEITIRSPLLEKQYEEHLERVVIANKETRKAKKEREIHDKKLMTLVKNQNIDISSPRIAYLGIEDRNLESYKGWLPTTRFDANGEVLRITEDLLKELHIEFPAIDINSKIMEIHCWLSKNSSKRKTLAQLPKFISMWIKNSRSALAITNLNDQIPSTLSLDDELAKLLG